MNLNVRANLDFRAVFGLFVFTLILLSNGVVVAQTDSATAYKRGIEHIDLLPTHHFGIFSSRIQQRYSVRPPNICIVQFSLSSGNVFQPYVNVHLPTDPATRERLKQTIWHDRQFTYVDDETTPVEAYNIVVDAVIKSFNLDYSFKLNDRNELGIGARGYLITRGRNPWSFFTNDKSIEWFHSNIAGGEDPFGRKYYGVNQANIDYTDRNGKRVKLGDGDAFFGGLTLRHTYYPKFSGLEAKQIFINMGSQIGVNASRFNGSLDAGLAVNAVKSWTLNEGLRLNSALGLGLLKKNVVNFDEVVDFGNNPFLGTFGLALELTRITQKQNYHSFQLQFRQQSSYNNKEEKDYYKLYGDWQAVNAGWHNSVTTLYKNLSVYSFVYTYAFKNYKLSLYISEDLKVNNAPDLQTGLGFSINIKD